ncbi:adhesion G-protein coupled receptor D1-like [Lytechinus pictus]
MFAWMAIEGVHLYLLTFVVWNAEKRKIKWYMACGWGIPFLFVAMMLAYNFIRHERYEQGIDFQNYCFLSMEDRSLLMFVVPVAVVIVFNIFVTIRVVCQIVKMSDGPTMQGDIKKRAKYGVKAMIVLLPIMGLTWVVGFLAVNRAKVIFLYAFIVLNCLQGVFIFFIHFFRNTEVRKAFRRQLDKWAVSQSFKGDSSSSRNGRKSSSSGGEKNLAAFRSPNQTVTLSNMSSTRAHNL